MITNFNEYCLTVNESELFEHFFRYYYETELTVNEKLELNLEDSLNENFFDKLKLLIYNDDNVFNALTFAQ